MNQGTSAIAPRSWAVRLLLVCMLAVCALMMHAPHGASAAMAPAGHSMSASTSAEASHQAAADQGAEATKTAIEIAVSLPAGTHAGPGAHDQQGDGCSCCPAPLDIAVACATVNTGSPQHGTLPRALDVDAFVTPDRAPSGSAAQRAAPPPSLAELSLLRI